MVNANDRFCYYRSNRGREILALRTRSEPTEMTVLITIGQGRWPFCASAWHERGIYRYGDQNLSCHRAVLGEGCSGVP